MSDALPPFAPPLVWFAKQEDGSIRPFYMPIQKSTPIEELKKA